MHGGASMSSVDISSSNDVTSTAASEADNRSIMALTLTTDTIIRQCIRQGFYRTPTCNERLYLHGHGFDAIAPTAFEPYNDVKVLWLEGNGFTSLPCGHGYTQVQPPPRRDPFAELHDVAEASAVTPATPSDSLQTAVHHVDPMESAPPSTLENSVKSPTADPPPLPAASTVPPEERDAFSSLYPTVRQLYLHHNLFRTMPDLSRFERLDAVNLSNNFFSAIEPHCPGWEAGIRCWDEEEAERQTKQLHHHGADDKVNGSAITPNTAARLSPSKCITRELQRQMKEKSVELAHSELAQSTPAGMSEGGASHACSPVSTLSLVNSAEALRQQREVQLTQYQQQAERLSLSCLHDAMPESEEEPVNRRGVAYQAPLVYRNPCSSLRTLNLAGNRIESFRDYVGLLCYKAVAALDLSQNNILDGEALLCVLERLQRLRSLKLSGNPLVRSMTKYRKRVLSRCKGLLYLDDRPVFEEERRLVTAWTRGGEDGEEKERALISEEKREAEHRRLDDFRRLLAQYRGDASSPGPHTDYINAVTNSTARRGHARRNRYHDGVGRRPSSDPDASPTSSDSEEEEDDGEVPRGVDIVGAEREAGALQDSNKPHRGAGGIPARSSSSRVLSSNRTTTASPPGAAPNGDDDNNDNNDSDVYVPS